jgi:phenylacetic acid degradation operon negative regulatory protein
VVVSSGVTDRNLPTIQPLTARNIVLSTLLGYHPPELPVAALVRVAALFGIAERAVRTAVSRMVSNGDLIASEGVYGLAPRLVARQDVQEASLSPAMTDWDGTWEIAIVTSPPRPLAERVALRKSMGRLRFAEMREGVWTRPANLVRDHNGAIAEQCTVFRARHDDDTTLVESLWNLDGWASEARHLRGVIDPNGDLKSGFMASALVIRHLLVDPCLPPALLPDRWPANELRNDYAAFIETVAARLREYSQAA